MKRTLLATVFALSLTPGAEAKQAQDIFPNGEEIPQWFTDTARIDTDTLGEKYVLTDHGVTNNPSLVQTEAIQQVIDKAARRGGGVVVVPRGTFLTGSLFFRQGTHLHLDEGAVLKGTDAIKHYPVVRTRMEGQTLNYFAALVNADSLDGFTITGPGTIDGNGLRFWEEFWIRREYNPECTNLEAMRPRLVYLSNCGNVRVQDTQLVNSPFWTNHLYKCHHVKFLGCHIFAPTTGVKAPSSDAIDLDACHDVLVSGCYMNVNDDAVALKGGKGTFADQDPDNGPNYNIIVENCTYDTVFACLTLGSESLRDWNVVMRDCTMRNADRMLWMKMRPDTPQHYEYVSVKNMRGKCGSVLYVRPWTQFHQPQERDDMPLSRCDNVSLSGIDVEAEYFLDVIESDKYTLGDFTITSCTVNGNTITTEMASEMISVVENLTVK